MVRHGGPADPEIEEGLAGYPARSKLPLQILVFLLPLIVAYEVSLAVVLRAGDGSVLMNKAHEAILLYFKTFGLPASGGLYLGGALIVVVLLVWHLLARDPWQFDARTPAIMAAESAVLTVPLIVIAVVIAGRAAAAPATDITQLGLGARLAISIGAGLYEELLFRMLMIAVIHTLLVDVGKASHLAGAAIAVGISSVAFAWYHPIGGLADALFYFVAGLYFGVIYVVRGFGIVVAVHAFYDVIVVSLMPGPAATP